MYVSSHMLERETDIDISCCLKYMVGVRADERE